MAIPNTSLNLARVLVVSVPDSRIPRFRGAVLLVLFLAGCGGGNLKSNDDAIAPTEGKADRADALPGYYEVVDATIDGEPELGMRGGYLVLRDDGTFKMVRTIPIGTQPKGDWELTEDERLYFKYTNGTSFDADMDIDGGQLVLSYIDNGLKWVLRYQRRELSEEPSESF